jgi:hypothetical protein
MKKFPYVFRKRQMRETMAFLDVAMVRGKATGVSTYLLN